VCVGSDEKEKKRNIWIEGVMIEVVVVQKGLSCQNLKSNVCMGRMWEKN